MPKYITPLGSACTADEAMPHGQLLPVYKELIAHKEEKCPADLGGVEICKPPISANYRAKLADNLASD